MKLREHFRIFGRGVKWMYRLSPTFTRCKIFEFFLDALKPYIPLYFSAKIIDGLYEGAELKTLAFYVAMAVGLSFLLNVVTSRMSAYAGCASSQIWWQEDWCFAQKAMGMAYETLEDSETKLLLERIKKENQTGWNVWRMQWILRGFIYHTTRIIASVSLTLTFFLLPSVPLAGKAAILAGIAAIVGYSVFSNAKGAKFDTEYMDACVGGNTMGSKLSELYDYSYGMDIRLYGMGDRIAKAEVDNNKMFLSIDIKRNKQQLALQLPESLLTELIRFMLYGILITAALAGGITVGSIAQYISCIFLLVSAVGGLVEAMQMLFANNVYYKRYFSYLDIPNNMYKGSLTLEKRDDNEYYVEFRNVSFKYPNTETYALRHVNIKFKVGEKLAIVGENGSGKTTMIKLMCRLYDPTEGEILLNGVNIQKYDYDEYMAAFSVVFQDFKLLAMTLGQNVAAASDYDKQRARDCLIKAGFGDRLNSLPEGCETYLYKHYDQSGIEISGGEAQKIALARALYKDSPFIILDEPTSALDPISEYEVYSHFNNIAGDKTAIYISHRLASCRFCDKIAVFHQGSIVQSGSHEVLLRDETGKYRELWNAQAQHYRR